MDIGRQFSTLTDRRWQILHETAVLFSAGIVGIIEIFLGSLNAGLIVLGFSILGALVNAGFIVCRKDFQLTFTGRTLLISHPRKADLVLTDIPVCKFICKQNFLERRFNVGRIHIKETNLLLYGVQNYEETCCCIQDNFPDF